MTCAERLDLEHPELKDETYLDAAIATGNLKNCPSDYGYLDDPDCCGKGIRCEDCWNREISEERR